MNTTGDSDVRVPLPPLTPPAEDAPVRGAYANLRFMPAGDAQHAGLVEDPHWTALIPYLHAALANPDANLPMPAAPPLGADLFDYCAYWETCVYLMTALLGWSNPANGLLWFYRNGMDDGGDPRLRLLREVWNSHGQLDLLAAWLWRDADCFPPVGNLPGVRVGQPAHGTQLEPSDGWWREFNAVKLPALHARHPHNPLEGGTNALHLGHSFQVFTPEPGAGGYLVAGAKDDGKAVLTLDRAAGWYGDLATVGAMLPPLQGKSWFIDVTVKPVGWLGAFRRSHLTGLWFLGRHSTHLAGQ